MIVKVAKRLFIDVHNFRMEKKITLGDGTPSFAVENTWLWLVQGQVVMSIRNDLGLLHKIKTSDTGNVILFYG